ncbi:flagellar biosynthesis protein FliQ [Oceanispirochaeta sp.]|jgi:flagellar biosynthetic protein FliQ|uniref:flagellar biosynthesis protein FliQ n=1 Tax=Oceanispirochaeta sp. TaxID=2035350 RepID=UPI002630316B|nr:flagellar biosynthesis protein FliQ [Oceanispirochaeta sp.]MDA3957833.1 flagellar biosynthesis protein FliQ [Oceanispirochaeta sp.]
MSIGFVVALLRNSVFQTLILAAPVLLVAMVIGLVISIFQATTSIQDQSLTFVPKILAIFSTLGFLGAWMANSLINFTITIFELIPSMAG